MQNEKNITPNHYCKSFNQWPDNWMGLDEDIEIGERILAGITPFILHLHKIGLSKKVIVKHMDNLWILGAQIIREMNYYGNKKYRMLNPEKLLLEFIGTEGGPLPSFIAINDTVIIKSYDSTCKKLYKFILTIN